MRLKDRFGTTGYKLSDQEKAEVAAMEAKYGKRESVNWPFPSSTRYVSKIEQVFPNEGRGLFEHEKAAVEEFRKKYGQRLNPFPRGLPKKLEGCEETVNEERAAVVEYLMKHNLTEFALEIQDGKHIVQPSNEVYQ